MATIRYGVPYEITVNAKDLASGRKISNKHYCVCGVQSVSPPAFGAPIAGSSSNLTAIQNFATSHTATITTRLNHNWQPTSWAIQAILGKRYSTPLLPISGLSSGTPVAITTPTAHGFVSGQSVWITGVTSPAAVNGVWVVTVTSPNSFTLNGSSIAALWSADGTVQMIQGAYEFLYADRAEVFTSLTAGSIAGDALPLFCTASIRRLNAGVGRGFRSRFSLSPMSESDSVDGGFTAGSLSSMGTALGTFVAGFQNGGSDATSKFMVYVALSHKIAFGQASPFTTSAAYTAAINGFNMQPNTGSLVRRKPKQTQTIT